MSPSVRFRKPTSIAYILDRDFSLMTTCTAEHELRTFFEQFGDVKDVKIVRDCTGVCKGYGFITYETEEEKCGVLEFKGRQLNIGPAIRKASSLSRTIGNEQRHHSSRYCSLQQRHAPDISERAYGLGQSGRVRRRSTDPGTDDLVPCSNYDICDRCYIPLVQANSMAYPVVVPQHVYVAPPLLCSQLQCLNAQQLQGISYAGQTPNNSQVMIY
ncbi:unnamed protein product [Soboliphyme baturini]|uniref:RRM domain-containing protein n=1 Tax=Soboliphyme baturini TaxID=241478 RepID=A0A183IGX7_9BILA|nr:unnamed protein product [Soboliphyme baturini]